MPVNSKKITQIVLVVICVAALAVMTAVAIGADLSKDKLSNVRFASEDGQIKITWQLPRVNRARGIRVRVSSDDGAITRMLSPSARTYTFTDGEHGTLYHLSVVEVYKNGRIGKKYRKDLLFLDYDALPDLPTVYVDTANGKDPPWSIAKKPSEDVWGDTISNNDYLDGTMTFEWAGHETVSTEMDIRVRGNYSTAHNKKKSYKLKLDQSVDMLDMGRDYADKEWILLNSGTSLNTYIGDYLGEVCGMEWVAHGMFVNVMLNGDWKGLYYLTESVNQDRADITNDGYIIENDMYFWRKGMVYFRVDNQIKQLAFTFKYPNITDQDDERVTEMRDYMNVVTKAIASQDGSVSDYIDFDTFAAWILVRDIMHTGDSGGSNMYYYLDNFDSDDYTTNQLKMGPLWDFDGGMQGSEVWHEDNTGWSDQHTADFTYFPFLFEMPSFRQAYQKKWQAVSGDLSEGLGEQLETLDDEEGDAIEASRALDGARWSTGRQTMREEINYDRNFIEERVNWINGAVGEW